MLYVVYHFGRKISASREASRCGQFKDVVGEKELCTSKIRKSANISLTKQREGNGRKFWKGGRRLFSINVLFFRGLLNSVVDFGSFASYIVVKIC